MGNISGPAKLTPFRSAGNPAMLGSTAITVPVCIAAIDSSISDAGLSQIIDIGFECQVVTNDSDVRRL